MSCCVLKWLWSMLHVKLGSLDVLQKALTQISMAVNCGLSKISLHCKGFKETTLNNQPAQSLTKEIS